MQAESAQDLADHLWLSRIFIGQARRWLSAGVGQRGQVHSIT
jgi:hypothetical protein